MFILKFMILLFVLIALLFNGLVLASNPNLSGPEKAIGIALYLILIIVTLNFVISYITYFHTKDKTGPVGDPGIRGQKGRSGRKGICKETCGRKICFVDVKTHAENVLNNELQKIRGTVQIAYPVKGKKLKKPHVKTELDKIKTRLLNEFEILGESDIKTTNIPQKDRIIVRISGNKKAGDELYKRFLKSKDAEDTAFLNITINGETYNPTILLEDINALSECLNESLDTKDNLGEKAASNDSLKIEVCEYNGEEKTTSVSSNSSTQSITSETVTQFTSALDRRYNIRNDYFIEKINKICNSKEYLESLERKTKNRVNEIKLIEYIKDTIEEMIIYLIAFRLKKIHGFSGNESEKNQQREQIIYAGLNFLLTKTADENYFDLYKENIDGEIVDIQSPIVELEKYDIYRWGTTYVNQPLILQKCVQDYKVPDGKEPSLKIVETNNYTEYYNCEPKDDIFYTGYSESCDSYCPYNQMGRKKTNLQNKSVCIYYNVNEKGHRNLQGSHATWMETQYMDSVPLKLFHPSVQSFTFNNEFDAESSVQAYHQDDVGIIYYPVGSVWTSKIKTNRKNVNDFTPNSYNKASGHSGTGPEKQTILVSGDIKAPIDFKKIWSNTDNLDNEQISTKQTNKITIWEPIPPKGYVALGHIVTDSVTAEGEKDIDKETLIKEQNKENEIYKVMCVPESCVIKIPIGPKIWDSSKLVKKNMGVETFTPKDRFILYLNCYLTENNSRSKNDILNKHAQFVISEETRLKNLVKNTDNHYFQANIPKLINQLRNLINQEPYKSWTNTSVNKLYNNVNTIRTQARNIEEQYQIRYTKQKDKIFKDIKKEGVNKDVTAEVFTANPVYIFSAGANKAYEESINLPNKEIKDDDGHNLFFACTDLKKAPKYAYKINRECLYKKSIKPIKSSKTAGILNYSRSADETQNPDNHFTAEGYFTFPKELILENSSTKNSPSEEPKRYYLTLNKVHEDGYPLYFIRAADVKSKEYSLCKIGLADDTIQDTEINVKDNRLLFTIKSTKSDSIQNLKSGDSFYNKPKTIALVNVEYTEKCFDQYYNKYGRNIEKLSGYSSQTGHKFLLRKFKLNENNGTNHTHESDTL
jgi:hypothetical protein